jgi:hypothetical protein
MHTRDLKRTLLIGLGLLFTALSPLSSAKALYEVNVDTNALKEPFSLDFILRDGSGRGDGNNTVQVLPYNYGEGTSALTDTSPFNETKIPLLAGYKRISFGIETTTNSESPPDVLIFRILDNADNPIPTTAMMSASDPFFADSFFAIVLNSATGTVYGPYGTDPSRTSITINVPEVRLLSPANVPEPTTFLLLIVGLAGLLRTGAWGRCLL